MPKQSGYIVTIKAFIPSPKTDFAKQAAAANAMLAITQNKALPDDFATIATILDIAGKYGSADIPDVAPPEQKPDPEAEAREAERLAAEEAEKLRLANEPPPVTGKRGKTAE